LSTAEIVRLMNAEDARVAKAVAESWPTLLARSINCAANSSRRASLLYRDRTSGRLGVLDASECPPTFGVSPDLVQAVIAGGYDACYRAVEASEDDAAAGARDLEQRGFTKADVLWDCGLGPHALYSRRRRICAANRGPDHSFYLRA